MDYTSLSVEEIKTGYRLDEAAGAYVCLACGAAFPMGEVFPEEGHFFTAPCAVQRHVQAAHGGVLPSLLGSASKYNTLTGNQKELLALFAAGLPDGEIAKRLGVSASTVRHHKFTFREKAKQAKYYLAMYELALGARAADGSAMAPVHNTAPALDDRFEVTEAERERILATGFYNLSPLKLKKFSPKEKKKVVILARIAEELEYGKKYTEKELNKILKAIYEDFATLRRYLVSYRFMARTSNGSEYWRL